jgi:hypothetical protein
MKQSDILQKLLLDNKVMVQELSIQLSVIQKIENEKKDLSNHLQAVRRESSLCLNRDELNIKRNAALVRENRLLKEKCEKLETEKLFLQKAAEEQVTSLTRSYENQLQVTEWNNEQLDIRLTVKDAKLKLSQKNCKNMRKVLKKRKASVA